MGCLLVCWICKKPVDEVSVTDDHHSGGKIITAKCHGELQQAQPPVEELVLMGTDTGLRLNGWAFKTTEEIQ